MTRACQCGTSFELACGRIFASTFSRLASVVLCKSRVREIGRAGKRRPGTGPYLQQRRRTRARMWLRRLIEISLRRPGPASRRSLPSAMTLEFYYPLEQLDFSGKTLILVCRITSTHTRTPQA
jgi:hypothetical protein